MPPHVMPRSTSEREPGPVAPRSTHWIARVCAVLQLSTIAAELIASIAFTPHYNWIKNTISELGVTVCTADFDPRSGIEACSPLHGLMNGAMVLSGVSLILLAIILRRTPGFIRTAGVLWVIAGIGTIVTGFVPLNASPVGHQIVSLPLFFGGPLAIIAGALQYRGALKVTGIALGSVVLVLGAVFSLSDIVYGYGGLVERIVVWPSSLWVMLLVFRRGGLREVTTTGRLLTKR